MSKNIPIALFVISSNWKQCKHTSIEWVEDGGGGMGEGETQHVSE